MAITEISVSDTETTGIDPTRDSLLEIAQVFLSTESPTIDGDWTFVEYEGVIPPEAKGVHHITEDMVRPGAMRCVSREVAVKSMTDLHHDGYAYAFHNAEFDVSFLPEIAHVPVICTYRCSMHLYPEAPNHKNQTLRYWLGVEPNPRLMDGLAPHRALYDSVVTAAILKRMLNTHTAEELVELSKRPILLEKVRFGKYKDSSWKDLVRDTGYVGWMRRSGNWDKDLDVMYTLDVLQGRREPLPPVA